MKMNSKIVYPKLHSVQRGWAADPPWPGDGNFEKVAWTGVLIQALSWIFIEIEITTGHRQVTIQIPSPVFDERHRYINSIAFNSTDYSKIHSFVSLGIRHHHRFIVEYGDNWCCITTLSMGSLKDWFVDYVLDSSTHKTTSTSLSVKL
jgi:hypothetical protein